VGENDELIKDFLVESQENLDRLDREFLVLEKDPSDRACLGSIFRTIHTIKGTSGFFGFSKLQAVTHIGESVLSRLRDGELSLHADMANGLLAMVDAIRQMLASIEATSLEGDADYSGLVARLGELHDAGGTISALTPKTPSQSASADPIKRDPGPLTAMFEAASTATSIASDTRSVQAGTAAPAQMPISDQMAKGDHAMDSTRTDRAAIAEPRGDQVHAANLADTSLRVDVGLLDRLMNLVGELVLARNQIMQFAQTRDGQGVQETSQRLNLLTSELQESVMKTRMQPIGNVWTKLPRLVRDLAKSCGKQVRIEMEGEGTELDKTLIEAIKDPLTHIVRNAIDHGFELPVARVAAGKPAEGLLKLRAFHEGGMVIIEIGDDGGGISPSRVKAKAIEKGLITTEQAERMDMEELIALIFLPGFSTAEQVTNISGRGVGMDVVKTNIERIGGHVDIQSRLAMGTTLRIKIPLTLAIVPALIVTSGGERFAIPQVSLIELVRVDSRASPSEIENIHGAQVYRLRGLLLPLVFLNRELRLPERAEHGLSTVVVLQAGERRFGLVVDGVSDAEEIVVKPLATVLKPLTVFSGSTIMGDGRVALILDVLGIAQRASAVAKSSDHQAPEASGQQMAKAQRLPLLIFQSPDNGRMAIPIDRISRLEELPRSRMERIGGMPAMQYRGRIVPLIEVFSLLPERRKEPRNPDCGVAHDLMHVVIHVVGDNSVGLVVGRIIDTVDIEPRIERAATRHGVLGCMVIQERITELLDIEQVVRTAFPTFYDQPQIAAT
jgi:two-component system chemotaxis sensor kinase CheA